MTDDNEKAKAKSKAKGKIANMILASKKITAAKKKASIFDTTDWLDEEFNDG